MQNGTLTCKKIYNICEKFRSMSVCEDCAFVKNIDPCQPVQAETGQYFSPMHKGPFLTGHGLKIQHKDEKKSDLMPP